MCENDLLQNLHQYVSSKGGHIIGINYRLVHPFMQFGEGDFLCELNGRIVAIECKFMGRERGKTARTRRNKHRKKISEQTLLHAAFAKLRHPSKNVRGAAVTNEGAYIVCDDISLEDAGRVVLKRLQNVDDGMIPRVSLQALTSLMKTIPLNVIDEVGISS